VSTANHNILRLECLDGQTPWFVGYAPLKEADTWIRVCFFPAPWGKHVTKPKDRRKVRRKPKVQIVCVSFLILGWTDILELQLYCGGCKRWLTLAPAPSLWHGQRRRVFIVGFEEINWYQAKRKSLDRRAVETRKLLLDRHPKCKPLCSHWYYYEKYLLSCLTRDILKPRWRVIGVATSLRPEKSLFRFLARSGNSSVLQNFVTKKKWGPCIWAIFPLPKSYRGVKLTTNFYLLLQLRMNGAIPPFLLYAIMVWTGPTS